jgi:DNA-binding CsgD family transcriptional regulator
VVGVLAGRASERSALCAWLDEALARSPRVVLLSGEAGAGKTRLLDQFLEDARERGVATAIGRAVEQDGAPPFWPWRLLLQQLDAPDLLGRSTIGDAPTQRFALFENTARWLADYASTRGGLAIGIDDLHGADAPSMRLLAHIAAGLRTVPLVLVTTHRPVTSASPELSGLLEGLLGLPVRRSIVLRNLDRAAVAEVLGHGVTDTTVDRVHELTGGNALFVSELARQLGDGAGVELIPDSLRALIGERLAARSPSCADVLRTASVAGREFAAAVVANASERTVLHTLALLDEAIGAGLVQRADDPGRFRFTHLLVRDIIEATSPGSELPALHRRVAEAIEAYEGTGDDHVHELAQHWDHAAVVGDADAAAIAAAWNERAADAADRALAWEQAVRLYERALVLSPADTEPETRHRRLIGAARGLLHSELVTRAVARCAEAADAAHAAGRPDLVADAALLIEGRGGSGGAEVTTVIDIAERALAGVDPLDHTRRARLFGLLTALYFYVDPTRCERLSREAAAEATRSGSPHAVVAAARARQMVRFGPEHAEERLELAREIGDAGRALHDSSVTQWEPLWRIDALLELGRVREAAGELPALRRLTESTRHPMARWHRMRSEAVIAAATGRWDDARRFGAIARDIHARQESYEAAVALELALQTTIGMQIGFQPGVLDEHDGLDFTRAPAYIDDIPTILPLLAKLALGRRIEAERDYDRLAPVADWYPPRFLWLPIHTLRLLAAFELDRRDDVCSILRRFEPFRGRHVAGGGGPIAYFGCVELYLGHGALVIGDVDGAIGDLRVAVQAAASATTPPFEVRAAALLAQALSERAQTDDLSEARALAKTYESRAAALGMRPWRERLERIEPALGGGTRGPLSIRELEVAGLVARGLTNNEIASELFISSRTAQNHVQHILTKLGLANRTQIATWHREQHT